jgi:hypothetical protein
MKKLLLVIVLFPIVVFSQQQPEKWYFGYNAGLDFSSGNPVPINNSAIIQWEGNATACDTMGNLEFYTDGVTVWDATNTVMPNGTGLLGNGSTTQSATIVPYPNYPEKYYLFTNTDINSANGFRYSVIDMTLNGGLGDVTSVKNVLLLDPVTEQCVVIPGNDGCTWILVRQYDAVWYAFLIDSSGIQPPVISYAGTVCDQTQAQGVGYLKASPLNDKIAFAKYGYIGSNSFFELYDFNNGTGEVSNSFQLTLNTSVYGCTFSPDGSRFYGAEWGSNLYQFDLTLGNVTDITNSKTLVGTTANFTAIGDLQIAPNEKIYCAIDNANHLGVINDPNALGTACNFVENGILLGGHTTGIGLPATIFFSTCNTVVNVESAFAANDTDVCEKFCIDFFDLSLNDPVSWQWFFSGGSPDFSTDQNPANICYDDAGQFDVTLVTTGSNGVNDTLTLNSFITAYENPLAPVITQNGNVLTSSPALTYQWQLNGINIPGATHQNDTIMQSGLYTMIITNENGCSAQSSIDASYVVGINETGNASITISQSTSDATITVQLINEPDTDVAIMVWNTIGQSVFYFNEKISSPAWKKNIDLGNLTKGIYFIVVQTSSCIANEKVMIMK